MALPFIGNDIWGAELKARALDDQEQAQRQKQLQAGISAISQAGSAIAAGLTAAKQNSMADTLMNQDSPPTAAPVLGPNGESPQELQGIRTAAFADQPTFQANYSPAGGADIPTFDPTAASSASPATGGVAELKLRQAMQANSMKSALTQSQVGVNNARADLYGGRTDALADPPAKAASGLVGQVEGASAQIAAMQSSLSNMDANGIPQDDPGRLAAQNALQGYQAIMANAVKTGKTPEDPNDPFVTITLPAPNDPVTGKEGLGGATFKLPHSQAVQQYPQFFQGATTNGANTPSPASDAAFKARFPNAPAATVQPDPLTSGIVPQASTAAPVAYPGASGLPVQGAAVNPSGTNTLMGGNGPDPYQNARLAIQQGANPQAVAARLVQAGLDPNQL